MTNRVYFEDLDEKTRDEHIERSICLCAMEFYKLNLFREHKYYLDLEVDISIETALRFDLGYASDSHGELIKHLNKMGFSKQDLAKSSLFKVGEKGELCEVFQDRLVIPIRDEYGNYIGFCGYSKDKQPKHLISSHSPAFDSKEHLFGLNFACEFDSLILCENYFGVIRMANNGVNNAVATFGTTFLTNSQVDLLKRHAEKVYIDPISDDLGMRFAAHALDLLRKNDISASIID